MQVKEPLSATSLVSSELFLNQLKDYNNALEKVSDSKELSRFIRESFMAVSDYYIDAGDQQHHNLNHPDTYDDVAVYLLHYSFPESFKDLALLHRDVMLQLQIAQHNEVEHVVTPDQLAAHFSQSKTLLIDALTHCIVTITQHSDAISTSKKVKKKVLSSIKHSTNPWGIYKSQFETIKGQLKDLTVNTVVIARTLKSFADIRSYNENFLLEVTNDTESLKKYLGESIRYIKELKSTDDIAAIASWIDKTIKTISNNVNLQNTYVDNVNLKIKTLTELTIPVSTDNGLLLTRKIDFNKTVHKWFDFEALPFLIDLWDHKGNMESYVKHSLLNLKSSLLIAKNNKDLETMPSQLQTLQNVHNTIATNGSKLQEIITEIEEKFKLHFLFTKIYTDDVFLEVSLQSSLSNFASGQSNFITKIKNTLGKKFLKINNKYEHTALFNTQSKVEQTMQCINYRMFKEVNLHYDTLFLNKNFIGDLFLLPRLTQESAITKSIAQWHNGFNNAILVTGDTLSGKSTFVEYIGQKHFQKNAIYLERDTTITHGGRKFTTTKNLKEALQSVKKGLTSSKSLLVIDDLELWRDDSISLLENTRALLSFIAAQSDDVLVIVTISKQMVSHIDRRLRFTGSFNTTVDVNKASIEEIYKAVLIRHGASHKELVSVKGELLTNKQIEQYVFKLARKLDYNIGDILQSWAYGTTIIDNNQVVYEDKDTGVKDFFNAEEVVILKYALLYKSISEKELKAFTGSSYESGYNQGLKRLINTKILLRQDNGKLKLNSLVAMDIKQILIYRSIIK